MAYNPFNNGQYNSTPPTLTSGQTSPIQLDVNGNQKVVLASGTAPSGAVLVQDGTPGDNSVLKEVLMELRAMRKLLFLLYEESNEGPPMGIIEDVDETNNIFDYQI